MIGFCFYIVSLFPTFSFMACCVSLPIHFETMNGHISEVFPTITQIPGDLCTDLGFISLLGWPD